MCSIGKAIGWMDPLHFIPAMHDQPKNNSRPSIAAVAAPVAAPPPPDQVPATAPPEGTTAKPADTSSTTPSPNQIAQTRKQVLNPLISSGASSGLSMPT